MRAFKVLLIPPEVYLLHIVLIRDVRSKLHKVHFKRDSYETHIRRALPLIVLHNHQSSITHCIQVVQLTFRVALT